MITINRIKDFVPGVLNIYALPIYNVDTIVNDIISIKDTNAYYKIQFASNSMKVVYNPVKTERGEYYEASISGFIPGESVANTKVLNIIRKYRCIVIYQESDGSFRWAGSRSTGFIINMTYNSGNDANPNKGYNIAFEAQLLDHPKPSKPYLVYQGQQIGLKPGDESASTE
jgi:hypothetical protein